MLAYTPYMDPMGYCQNQKKRFYGGIMPNIPHVETTPGDVEH